MSNSENNNTKSEQTGETSSDDDVVRPSLSMTRKHLNYLDELIDSGNNITRSGTVQDAIVHYYRYSKNGKVEEKKLSLLNQIIDKLDLIEEEVNKPSSIHISPQTPDTTPSEQSSETATQSPINEVKMEIHNQLRKLDSPTAAEIAEHSGLDIGSTRRGLKSLIAASMVESKDRDHGTVYSIKKTTTQNDK